MSGAAENAENKITVVADDTDVFVLLLQYRHMTNLKNVVLIESPIKGRTVVDIGKTVQKHSEIVEGILPAHALAGCDTAAFYFGIGKATVLKTLRSGHSLNLLVHQGILWNMLFNRLPPSFPHAMDKQTVVQCQRQG